jgi:hypothetical protein
VGAIIDILKQFSSPTIGRGDVHGSQRGFIVYEDQVPFIEAALRRQFGWSTGAPTFDLLAHLERQHAWSTKTFGPGERLAGVLDHITKEIEEVRKQPTDIEGWIDIVILALDGALRRTDAPSTVFVRLGSSLFVGGLAITPHAALTMISIHIKHLRQGSEGLASFIEIVDYAADGMRGQGFTRQQMIDALVAKQTKNEARTWPDWRTQPLDKAIEHVRVLEDVGGGP